MHGASVIEVRLSYLRPAVEALAAKVDQANQDRAAGDVMLAEKIDNVSKVVLKIDSQLAAILWVGGGLVALVTLAITVGKAFKWFQCAGTLRDSGKPMGVASIQATHGTSSQIPA